MANVDTNTLCQEGTDIDFSTKKFSETDIHQTWNYSVKGHPMYSGA
jgi:hypothetical protein